MNDENLIEKKRQNERNDNDDNNQMIITSVPMINSEEDKIGKNISYEDEETR